MGRVKIRLLAAAMVALLLAVTASSSAVRADASPPATGTAPLVVVATQVECYWLVKPKRGTVTVRSGPSTKNRIVFKLKPPGRLFYRYTTRKGWHAVGDEGAYRVGYVSSSVTKVFYRCFRY